MSSKHEAKPEPEYVGKHRAVEKAPQNPKGVEGWSAGAQHRPSHPEGWQPGGR